MPDSSIASSFRDPSGFVYRKDGTIYRQINKVYQKDYDRLMSSGLYDALQNRKLLISHEEVDSNQRDTNCYKTLKPLQVPFITYAHEWCFSQLKDAALTTLEIQLLALEYGMSLKDGNAYNIQFIEGKPCLIDTLSFESYEEGQPWIAYKQFCQHFLAPIALMSLVDVRLNQLLRVYIDGIPIDLASRLLPRRSRLSLGLLLHVHLHAKSQKKFEGEAVIQYSEQKKMPKNSLVSLIENLRQTIRGLNWNPAGTQWAEYYTFTNYTDAGFENKKKLVTEYLKQVKPKSMWDLGGNLGTFSRLGVELGIRTCCLDSDPAAVEKNYQRVCQNGESLHLPLYTDLTNPSPGGGWGHEEWQSLASRGPADLCMALAIIHHLALGNNLPFLKIAEYFAKLCKYLIIEFVPKEDSQVVKLMQNRENVRETYRIEHFEKEFGEYFEIIGKKTIEASKRTLYLMKKLTSKIEQN